VIPIWVNFGGSFNKRCWSILLSFDIFTAFCYMYFCGHWVYFYRFGMLYQEKSGTSNANRSQEDEFSTVQKNVTFIHTYVPTYAILVSRNSLLTDALLLEYQSTAGLPDFSCCNTPKWENIYQITTEYTKWR
jgi:hypothetical protein